MQVSQDWLTDRRAFLAISGAALASAVWRYLAGSTSLGRLDGDGGAADAMLIAQIEQSIPLLQQIDDAKGGAANLGYVGAQVRAVSLVLDEGGRNTSSTRRLMVALAELAQLAGWMAHDADQHGLAQRYLFTALRAAREAGHPAMAGHALADLSVQATALGQAGDAIMLGEAAQREAAKSTPSVRASIASRLAHAYAGAGQQDAFRRARHEALDLISRRNPAHDPAWMYYLTPNHLDCQAGYSLIILGRQQRSGGDVASAKTAIREGQRLLFTGAHDRALADPSQRRALYEGAWLALGCAARGQLTEACDIGRTAVARLDQVRSPRSIRVLRTLARDLNRRKRSQPVADFLPELRSALGRQAA